MAVDAVGLAGVHGGRSGAAENVLSLRHCLEMVGTHAEWDSAEMVDLESLRDWGNYQLVGQAMDVDIAPPSPEPDRPVALTVGGSSPDPAVAALVDPRPKSLFDWLAS